MKIIICKKKGCDVFDESKLELHHLVPKFMGGRDIDGRAYLCKKHHDILTKITPAIIFRFVPIEQEEKCRQKVKEFSLKWINK